MIRALTIPLAAGSEPEIDDCSEAIGATDIDGDATVDECVARVIEIGLDTHLPVDLVAAARLQLRLHPGGARDRRLVGHEAARLPPSADRLPADRSCGAVYRFPFTSPL